MSRATVDLQAVRFFLGYGLIFILQSALTILIAAAVMFALDPKLAAVSLAPMPFVIWVAFRYGRLNRPASVEVQQRIAELTASAEENIGGVRVVKAFAQEDAPARALPVRRGARVRPVDGLHPAARLLFAPNRLPAPARPGGAAARGRQAGDQRSLSVGEFVAFYGYVLMLTSPMRMLGIALGMAQRAVASGQRVFELLDREPRLTSAPGARALPSGGGRVELRGVAFGYDGRRAGAARHRPDGRGGQDGRARGSDRLGQDNARDADPAPLRRHARGGAGGRRGRPRPRSCVAAARGRRGLRRRLPLLRQPARQHRLRVAGGRRRRGHRGGRAGRARAS